VPRLEVTTVPAWAFVRATLLDSRSPACLWRHPWQAARVARGAAVNLAAGLREQIAPGGARECPVCGWRGRAFRTFLSADEVIPHSICPGCGSFDRHRQLVLGVREELRRVHGREPAVMIGFSLSSAMRYLLEHEGLRRCYRSDVDASDRRFSPDLVTDLRQAAVRNDSVDWVFCSHVLEHIAELEPCVDELLRMLRPGGTAWIQVPIEPGLSCSRSIPIDPHRAHAHAWQFGPDFGDLLERPGWEIREIRAEETLATELRQRYGIAAEERYWRARKRTASGQA
jgi:SAM-dependent methyltransferase